MDLSFTPLQEELREQARRFLADTAEPTWAQLAELGWTGASVAEEHGGAGLGFLEEAVLHEAAGGALRVPVRPDVAVERADQFAGSARALCGPGQGRDLG